MAAPRKRVAKKDTPETPEIPAQRETAAITTDPKGGARGVRVRILTSVSGVAGTLEAGEIVTMPTGQADSWCATGLAERA